MGYRIVRMAEELFSLVMTQGNRVPPHPGKRLRVVTGLPDGAKLELVSMEVYFTQGQVALRYSHPSWDDAPPGHAIPELLIQYVLEDDAPDGPDDLTALEELALRRKELPRADSGKPVATPTPAWGTEPPAAPGWYWQRWTPHAPELVYVTADRLVRTAFNPAPLAPAQFAGCQWWPLPVEAPK